MERLRIVRSRKNRKPIKSKSLPHCLPLRIYENLNTYLNKTSERLTTLSNEFASAVDKQNGSGFSLSDAKGLIQKFNLDTDFKQLFNYDFIKGAYTLTEGGLKQLSEQLNK